MFPHLHRAFYDALTHKYIPPTIEHFKLNGPSMRGISTIHTVSTFRLQDPNGGLGDHLVTVSNKLTFCIHVSTLLGLACLSIMTVPLSGLSNPLVHSVCGGYALGVYEAQNRDHRW